MDLLGLTELADFPHSIWRIMRLVAEGGVTILACSHDPNHMSWFCDKVVVMKDNRILKEGSSQNVITEDTMDEIYQDMCSVRNVGGIKMVLPSDVALQDRTDGLGHDATVEVGII